MKDTRFRVWDGEHLHTPPHGFVICSDGGVGKRGDECGIEWHPPDLVGSFYTGEQDTEGQPIYEKDVLLVKGNRYVVEFDVEAGGYTLEGPGTYPLLPEIIQMGGGGVVIGNTFENPDLIE
jgi:hypothetical protein